MEGTELLEYFELQGNLDMVSKSDLLEVVRERGGRVTARQLTSWVTEGLLPRSAQIGSKHGAYPKIVVDVVAWIDESRRRGLSVEAIKELLPLWRFLRKGFGARRVDFQEFEYLARQFVRSPEAIHAVPQLLLDCMPCPICEADALRDTAYVMKGNIEFNKLEQSFVPLTFLFAREDEHGKGHVVGRAELALPLTEPQEQNAIVLGIPNGVPLHVTHDETVSIGPSQAGGSVAEPKGG